MHPIAFIVVEGMVRMDDSFKVGLNRARMGLGQRDTSTKATPHGLTPLSNPALYNYTRRSDSLRANNSLTRGKHG